MLLVTSSRRPDNWIVPGGGVEPEEEPSVTAMREVLEEAGVIGKLGRCLGVFEVIVWENNILYVITSWQDKDMSTLTPYVAIKFSCEIQHYGCAYYYKVSYDYHIQVKQHNQNIFW